MRTVIAAMALAGALCALDPAVSLSQYARKRWQVEDGLPQNYVTSLAQTAEGYLLVGTAGGAARFDGVRFTPLVLDSATGISREWITAIQPGAKAGEVWIATRDAGFYLHGRKHWPYRIDSLIVDRLGEPVGLGPGVFRRESGEMTRFREGLSPADPSWYGLLELPAGGVLAAASQGLFLLRGREAVPLLPPPGGRSLALAPARSGGFWLGASNGLYRGRFDRNGRAAFTPVPGVRGPVVAIVEDRDGLVWVGTWGLGLIRLAHGRVEFFTTREGLEDDFVHALLEDREGNLWIGTRAGLSRWKSTPVLPIGPAEGLGAHFLSSVSGERDGTVWLGSWRSGLYRVRNAIPERVPLPAADLTTLVRSTAVSPAGDLWLSTWSGLYQRSGGRWIDQRQGDVHALLFDRRGRLWIGSGAGLDMRDGERRERPLSGHGVRALLEDSRGRLWAGGPDGLWILDADAPPAPVRGLPHPHVTSISEDSLGRIWVTTRANGLALAAPDGVRVLDQRHGLPALPLYAAVDDGRGALWLSSPAGVFELPAGALNELLAGRRPRVPVVAYGQDDGMRTIECQNVGFPSAWKDPGGDIWFPTVRGAIRIRPGARRPSTPPAVLVESVVTGRQAHAVRFTAARLGAPSRLEFRYRMAAGPAEWNYLGPERTLRFDGLRAGDHTLLVAARERGGEWGEPTAVDLRQAPRWYETWWFRLAALLSAAGVLALLYRWRMYLLRARYAAVIVERNRIAREWHDTLLAGFSAISWQLDATLDRLKNRPETAAGAVETARTMVHHFRAEARRVIWDLRHDAPVEQSLAAAIAGALEQIGSGRGVVSQVAVEGQVRPIPGDMAQNLLRICQEAAGNAIRHGQAGRIDVELRYAPGRVAVEVRDNGHGFDPGAVPPGHFGLEIMRERARRFGGELRVASAAGAGATVTAILPLGAMSS